MIRMLAVSITMILILGGTNLLAEQSHELSSLFVSTDNSEGVLIHQAALDIPFLVDSNLGYGSSYGKELSPDLAFDGSNYMAAWLSRRGSIDYSIYACRVNTAGQPMDVGGIRISSYGKYATAPSIAWNGTYFLVVWEDIRGGIYGARLTSTGDLLDPDGFQISPNTFPEFGPDVSSDGTNFLVVWTEMIVSGDYDVKGSIINSNGNTVVAPFGIGTGPDMQWQPTIAYGTTSFMVMWKDERNSGRYDIYGTRVSSAGAILDPGYIVISTSSYMHGPRLGYGSNLYLVTWHSYGGFPAKNNVYAARISTTGTILDPVGITVCSADDNQTPTGVAHDGNNFMIVFEDDRNDDGTYGARVDATGNVLDPDGIPIASDRGNGAVAFDGTNYLIATNGIYGYRVNPSMTILDPSGQCISLASYYQYYPAAAFNGSNYLLVWADLRNGDFDIYGSRIGTDGSVLDPAGIPIGLAIDNQINPSVASNGSDWMVVWKDKRVGTVNISEIYGNHVAADGTVLDPSGVRVSESMSVLADHPEISFGGSKYLAVWHEYRTVTRNDIVGNQIDQSGLVLNPTSIDISAAANEQQYPDIAFDGTNFFVAWHGNRFGGYDNILGRRIDTNGVAIAPDYVTVSGAFHNQYHPAVAYDGTNFLVVWEDYRDTLAEATIYGCRVPGGSGNALDPGGLPIAIDAHRHTNPDVAFIDGSFQTVWREMVDQSYDPDLRGCTVETDGSASASTAIASDPGMFYRPGVVAGTGSSLLTFWSQWTAEIDGAPAEGMRIWALVTGDASCCQTPGDANHDGNLDITDLTYTVDYMFAGGSAPVCYEEGDVNGDCSLDITDLTYRVDWMFAGGVPPVDCHSCAK